MSEEALNSKTTLPPSGDRATRMHALTEGNYDPKTYEFDSKFKPAHPENPWTVHTTAELLQCLEKNPQIELDARVLAFTKDGLKRVPTNAKQFKESFGKYDDKILKMLEGGDSFANDTGSFSSFVGQDFTPLLGGPFYKNQYYYEDYIRMHSECFFAYHHDPIAKAFMSITKDFVLGTGFEVQCDTSDRKGAVALATWKAFVKANDLDQQIDDACNELGIYGEVMWWKLPKNQTKIIYRLGPQDTIPLGVIPRVRLLDPSNMVEIVTYPEDITRKLFYVWLTPTQYQIYTAGTTSGLADSVPVQPTLKFIYQQILADQILHYKVNSVSNEKRGRSDLFPILGYLKRLRDTVDYSIIALQKQSAWAIDTTIDGNQGDIDAYVASQRALGTIPQAGSEFVHSKAVTREFLASAGGKGMSSEAFLWVLSMCCAGVQIPFNYLGTHLSGGSTRASAIVATEPVAKKMEKRREMIKRMIQDLWDWLMSEAGLGEIPCHIIFPEIITQDRSAKFKDLALGQEQGWFSPQRAATTAAKEMGFNDYEYKTEVEEIKEEMDDLPQPLTAPAQTDAEMPIPAEKPEMAGGGIDQDEESQMALTGQDRSEIKSYGTKL